MSVSEVLQWVESNRKSGTLAIETKRFWKKLYFRDGFIFFASSNREGERLGQFLISQGVLTAEELEACLERARRVGDVRKLSELLVEMGFLSQSKLLELLNELIQEIVYDCFLYESGDFEFRDGQLPAEVLTGFGLSPQEVAMEGLRRLDEYQRDLASLPDETMVLERAGVPVDRVEKILGTEGRDLFLLIDGVSSTLDILERSPYPVRRTQTLLTTLISGGAVVPKKRATGKPQPPPPPPPTPAVLNPNSTAPPLALATPPPSTMTVKPSGYAPQPQPKAVPSYKPAPTFDPSEGSLEERVGPPDTVLTMHYSLDKPDDFQNLDAEEGFVLSRIGDRATVREVLLVSGLRKDRGYQVLWNLIRKGYVKTRRQ